jgi:hypothetical protein
MRKRICWSLTVGLVAFAAAAGADTRKVSWTQYNVGLETGEAIASADGSKMRVGQRTHILLVDASGATLSGWCTGQEDLTAAEESVQGGGYCAIYEDNGDMFYVGYVNKGTEPTSWTVTGGTGKYEGATGSGKTTFVSQRGGGGAWTFKSEGSMTTK